VKQYFDTGLGWKQAKNESWFCFRITVVFLIRTSMLNSEAGTTNKKPHSTSNGWRNEMRSLSITLEEPFNEKWLLCHHITSHSDGKGKTCHSMSRSQSRNRECGSVVVRVSHWGFPQWEQSGHRCHVSIIARTKAVPGISPCYHW